MQLCERLRDLPMVLLQPIRCQRHDNEDEQRQVFLRVEVGLFAGNIAMIDIFVQPSGNNKQQQRGQDNQVVRHQCVREHDRQDKANRSMEKMFRPAYFSAAKMKHVVFGRVTKEWHKRQNENGRSHVVRLLDSGMIVNLPKAGMDLRKRLVARSRSAQATGPSVP